MAEIYQTYIKPYQAIIFIVLASLIIMYASVSVLGPNNPVEEVAEEVIEKETGLILKPNTPPLKLTS